MTDTAIKIEGIGKQYRIGLNESGGMYRYKSLGETLSQTARRPWKLVTDRLGNRLNDDNSFWALKDVSFEVKKGECVGIIGRNGAGKSTLLKILSRITKPTTGQIELHGRVGSLLEVGTGFHPELTGRENIYLNGAVLGMTRAEVKSKFDEIVAFSEIERFLDTPVKQYSSGMYTRLAFAVAAHLEPEILVVDEVLAVGDAAFQKKCLGKMRDVAGEGRTVLFVSHNMPAITTLCDRGVVLNEGQVAFDGNARAAAQAYLDRSSRTNKNHAHHEFDRPAGKPAWVTGVTTTQINGRPSTTFDSGDDLTIVINYVGDVPFVPNVGIIVASTDGIPVVHASTRIMGGTRIERPATHGTLKVTLPALTLTPGEYCLTMFFGDRGADHQQLVDIAPFSVEPADRYGSGMAYQRQHSYTWWPAIIEGSPECSVADPIGLHATFASGV